MLGSMQKNKTTNKTSFSEIYFSKFPSKKKQARQKRKLQQQQQNKSVRMRKDQEGKLNIKQEITSSICKTKQKQKGIIFPAE